MFFVNLSIFINLTITKKGNIYENASLFIVACLLIVPLMYPQSNYIKIMRETNARS